jgi:hypothetical protein
MGKIPSGKEKIDMRCQMAVGKPAALWRRERISPLWDDNGVVGQGLWPIGRREMM